MTTAQVLVLVAITGLTSSTVFLILTLVAAIRFRRRRFADGSGVANLPPVTLLKPLCGLEPNLEANIESFFAQDYPRYEVIFATRDGSDPALEVVRSVQQRHPEVPVKIAHSGEPDRSNAKVCSLKRMLPLAAYDYLVISDSDVQVSSGYLREVVGPLLDNKVGMVTCLYRGVPAGGIWSRLEALGMSVEMTSGVIVADALEGMKFALGPTMALRREVLHAAGGLEALADYCSDDYLLGQRISRSGRIVMLSRHVIDHVVLNRSLQASVAHQVRWMKSTRMSRSKGHVGMGLTFAMPFGALGLLAGWAGDNPWLGAALLAWAVANRIVMSVAVGWGVVRDRLALRDCWLYPVRDLLGFGFWCASFLSRTIVWRGTRYRLEQDGRMTRLGAVDSKSSSETIAIDNLA